MPQAYLLLHVWKELGEGAFECLLHVCHAIARTTDVLFFTDLSELRKGPFADFLCLTRKKAEAVFNIVSCAVRVVIAAR